MTLIAGDGIGAEVVAAARRIVDATGVGLQWDEQVAGAAVFKKGIKSGVPEETIASIQKNKVALKGPLETPVGYGEKSANVTLRKVFETYGNIRPIRELPGVKTRFSGSGVDLVVVRENVEDLYAGIEHQQTPNVAQCLKLMSRSGCEKIIRLAFEVARAEGRRTVHCATKANIMKLTEGLMKRTFESLAPEYADIKAEHIIVDNCAHQLVRFPQHFEVIVTSNMNGDILSDLTSGLVGGLGFAPGVNIGSEVAIFEAVHGSAPNLAGKNAANPSAVILSSVMLLKHLGLTEAAALIKNALLATLEAGIVTGDVDTDRQKVSTSQFTDSVIEHFGKMPSQFSARISRPVSLPVFDKVNKGAQPTSRRTVGVDVFIESIEGVETIGKRLEGLAKETTLQLKMISNRGVKVYPGSAGFADCVDHWRCRFMLDSTTDELSDAVIISLLTRVGAHFRWMHLEKLAEFDGKPGFSKAQGED